MRDWRAQCHGGGITAVKSHSPTGGEATVRHAEEVSERECAIPPSAAMPGHITVGITHSPAQKRAAESAPTEPKVRFRKYKNVFFFPE